MSGGTSNGTTYMLPTQLREVAEALGFTVGQYRMVRLAEDAAILESMNKCIRVGTAWPDSPKLKPHELRRLRDNLEHEFLQREEIVMNYIYAKLQSTQSAVTMTERPNIVSDRPQTEDEWAAEHCVEPATGAAKGSR